MLHTLRSLRGYTIRAVDGPIGSVDEFLFDGEQWVIRYVTVNTGSWLTGRTILLSPIAIRQINTGNQVIVVNLTRERVENGPDVATDQPISRQKEAEYSTYYSYAPYWSGFGIWGAGYYPGLLGLPTSSPPTAVPPSHAEGANQQPSTGDPHLHSTHEVTGYHIQATDDEIGHIDDFIVDDETWRIHYLVGDTRNWWPGKQVLVSPQWISAISWANQRVSVDLTREQVKESPEYDPSRHLTQADERKLYEHYMRQDRWDRQLNDVNHRT